VEALDGLNSFDQSAAQIGEVAFLVKGKLVALGNPGCDSNCLSAKTRARRSA
jgi:hypothetical protein